LIVISYRGIITFSRGGVLVGVFIVLVLLYTIYSKTSIRTKSKIVLLTIISFFVASGIFTYSSLQTDGMINKRYANQNASGVQKESILTGRETLMASELNMFIENPLLGVGVGRNKEVREEETGIDLATHSEVTRLLAEHGLLGFFALIILISVPLYLYPQNQKNIFLLSFFFFW